MKVRLKEREGERKRGRESDAGEPVCFKSILLIIRKREVEGDRKNKLPFNVVLNFTFKLT